MTEKNQYRVEYSHYDCDNRYRGKSIRNVFADDEPEAIRLVRETLDTNGPYKPELFVTEVRRV